MACPRRDSTLKLLLRAGKIRKAITVMSLLQDCKKQSGKYMEPWDDVLYVLYHYHHYHNHHHYILSYFSSCMLYFYFCYFVQHTKPAAFSLSDIIYIFLKIKKNNIVSSKTHKKAHEPQIKTKNWKWAKVWKINLLGNQVFLRGNEAKC